MAVQEMSVVADPLSWSTRSMPAERDQGPHVTEPR
jgi:hypothetical protein